jgi:hypothetical protein
MENVSDKKKRNICLKYWVFFSSSDALDENPKVNQLEDDRFNRMEHFYGTDEIDPETLEDLDLGDDGKVKTSVKKFFK